ncbi:MAG: bifunctional protein PutA [Phycisphaerae bacterium]|nr:MAG: bifunctional protein PutA [Phycisphaerae bacterium]
MALFSRKPKAPATISASTPSPAGSGLEPRIFEIGSDLLARARAHKSGLLSAKFYSDALMEWSMKDPNFKVQLFRFVDCFPMLRTPEDIYDHLDDYLAQPGVTTPAVIDAAMKAGKLAKGLAASQISKQITGMASKFIAGTDAASALPGLKQMWDDGVGFSVDLLGEVCVSDEEADAYQAKYLDLIRNLPAAVAAWQPNPRLESDHLGAIPRTNVSIKVSALTARFDPIDPEGSIRDAMKRIVPILETARDRGVFVNFDMEHYALKDLTIDLFMRCVETVDFQAGLAMQAYLRSGPDDARRVCEWAKAKGKAVTVRLVKGAYWDAEIIKSELHGWPIPVWSEKWQTDACYERMLAIYLDACPRGRGEPGVKLALGSHNARSIAAALAMLDQRSLPRAAIELQMLHGMADQLKFAASDMGLRVREYVPVGEMIPGMAYLVRRLLENTSNESWLKAGFLDNADVGQLLRAPGPRHGAAPTVASLSPEALPERHNLSPGIPGMENSRPFFNEPLRDFADARQRDAFAAAVAKATVPKIINDRTPDHAREMVGKAAAAFPLWRDLEPRVRAAVLMGAAARMRAERDGLSGVMVKEAGKTWREADADICEAIDFCEFYARCAVPLFERQRLGRFIGELDEQWHQPRGVAVVIAPWNFPLAICCGMTTAALATGNTAVVKASEQTLGIASIMVDILKESLHKVLASLPKDSAYAKGRLKPDDILQFCPGPGSRTGAALVRDPRVALIAFTGSREVGLDILSAAAPPSPFDKSRPFGAPTHVKKVVCEMGGKNALIVDTSADFDEAVLAVRYSAFGYQGQKCSACSRCIIVDPAGPDGPAFTAFRRRLVEATKALVVGDPAKPGTDIGPVIDQGSKEKIEGFITRAKASGLQHASLDVPAGLEAATGRDYVAPHLFWPVPPSHELAQEEIFGPVLALMHAHDFDEALRIANDSVFKLTGGVFTRKPSHIERAKRDFRVGNLYINRGITGALVGRHPFGGSGMSGVGTKAGGLEYLYHFVEPRNAAENTMRRGFAPEL